MADLGGGSVMSTREGDQGLKLRLAAAEAKGDLCLEKDKAGVDIRRHMSTAYAARDMLEILKRLPLNAADSRTPELKFIGLSYGTMVGQTFASLYPEHVHRMVLDGAVDTEDWVGKWQMGHLNDPDAVWDSFFEDCFQAKEYRGLWRANDTDSADIKTRVEDFFKQIKRRLVDTVAGGNARLITYRDVMLAIYWTLMAPGFGAPSMTNRLDSLMRGRTNMLLDFPFDNGLTASNFLDMNNQDSLAEINADAGTALNCADAEDISDSSISDFGSYLFALEVQSPLAAFFQAERRIRCMGWKIRPEWRFTGPFGSDRAGGSPKVLMPILFIGNRLDPMTSINNARKAARDYPGSIVLEENGRGHCALGNAVPSHCLLEYLRSYLGDGTLPEQETVCGKECNLFDGGCLGVASKRLQF